MKRVVIFGKYGSRNVGDEAILTTILRDLSLISINNNIVVLSEDPEWTRHTFKCNALKASVFNPFTFLQLLKAEVIILGGGNILQDNFSIFNIPHYTIPVLLSKLAGARLLIYNVGVGPLKTFLGKSLVKLCCAVAQTILVRDEDSVKILKKIGVKKDIQLSIDPAVSLINESKEMDYTQLVPKSNCKKNLIVAICPAFAFYVEKRFNLKSFIPIDYRIKLKMLPQDFEDKTNRLVNSLSGTADWLINNYNAKVIFVPMWAKRDNFIIRKVVENMNNKSGYSWLKKDLLPEEAINIISGADILIGMRLHSLIFASVIGLPFIGIAYSDKVKRLIKRVGMLDYYFEADTINSVLLIEKLNDLICNSDNIKSKLKAQGSELKSLHKINIASLENIMHI